MTTPTADAAIPAGLAALHHEMSKQHRDALDSYHANGEVAAQIAASVKRTRRLILLGMGGSQAVNRMAEPDYRAQDIRCLALTLSEQLYTPLDLADATVIVTSQSGESAEVHRLFESFGARADVFGLTLEGGSTLARTCPSLIGAGGSEKAFAATRSLLISLALHQRVLAELGVDPAAALQILQAPIDPDITAAADKLQDCETIVFSGRGLRGLAEGAALGAMELARMPAYALEGGQFRHGPLEILGPKVGVVVVRGDEPAAGLCEDLARQTVAAGSPTVLIDASGQDSKSGALQVSVGQARDLAANLALLPPAQRLVIEIARRRVADVGTPIRSGKVTRVE
ncbi:MAG: aminotransferase [Rhodospirillaceae bacterium]|nr:MAG: aminotransferase [Rhodospirillaceae bacterium]